MCVCGLSSARRRSSESARARTLTSKCPLSCQQSDPLGAQTVTHDETLVACERTACERLQGARQTITGGHLDNDLYKMSDPFLTNINFFQMHVSVRSSMSAVKRVRVKAHAEPADLSAALGESFSAGRFVFGESVLEETKSLVEQGIMDQSTVTFVPSVKSGRSLVMSVDSAVDATAVALGNALIGAGQGLKESVDATYWRQKCQAAESRVAELEATVAQQDATIKDLQAHVARQDETIRELRKENAALRAENAALRAENAALRAENAHLKAQIEQLQVQVAQLQVQVAQLMADMKLKR